MGRFLSCFYCGEQGSFTGAGGVRLIGITGGAVTPPYQVEVFGGVNVLVLAHSLATLEACPAF